MKSYQRWLSLLTLTFASSASQSAVTYDLRNDFSNSNNPNGSWSFMQGTSTFQHYFPVTPNSLNPVLGNGYWGTGTNLYANTPEIAKVTNNGSLATGVDGISYKDSDFLAGDIIVHSTNPGTGNPIILRWTAPSNGILDFSISLWYAQSPVTRSNEVSVSLSGVNYGSATINSTRTRSSPATFAAVARPVLAGDVLSITFVPSAGQTFGTINGVNETIQFTASPVPEPATAAILLFGLACLGVQARRQRSALRQ